ncbi:MAG TPA: efflux RND transporter permease subunit, partial [Saprospiraceae bacterium]|nr:efflux RND transporter permease subunit [Saprospiraceae bacterium]
ANDVRDKVTGAVRQLPRDLDGIPVVSKADANSDYIISMTLTNPNVSIIELSDYAENELQPRFQSINGVSNVAIWGQKRLSMRIWMNPQKMASLGVTTLDIKNALDRENIELPSGKIQGRMTELTVKTSGRFTSEEDFNNLIIKTEGLRQISLKDIGYASIEAENQETLLRVNKVPMVALALQPQPGSNYIDISNELYKRLEEVKKDLAPGYELNLLFDNTIFVKHSITEVKETLLIAVGLVVIIIFLFFRDWIIAIRPLIDIPVSLIGTFFVMWIMGFSINVLTLLAIVLATGLVVDDGIVVTENIFKKLEEGYSPIQAAIKGANEIIFAILSTSITLAAVFLPVIFMEGFVGKLFREFGIVLAAAVLISAFVSLTLTPMLNAYLVRKNKKPTWFYTVTEPFYAGMETNYEKGLISFLKRKWFALPILVACFGMIYAFGSKLQSELAPIEDRSWLRISMSTPEGSSYDFMDNYVQQSANRITESAPEVDVMLTVTAPGFAGSGAPNTAFGRIMLSDPSQRERSQTEIANQINGIFRSMGNGRAFASEQQTISLNRRGGLPMQYV